jgi:NAD(P)-dependent dehydrogenase (short-subunit alcohol dehydrogenase family)
MRRFEGRAAVVTGAGSGIGAATARRLAQEGARVAVSDVDEGRAKEVASSIESAGGRAIALRTDVSIRAEVEALIAHASEALEGLDILVNNAGIGVFAPMGALDDATIDRVIGINQKGVLYGMAVAGPRMVASGGGVIVNVASVAGLLGTPMDVLYSATKGAVLAMTRSAAMELAPTVRVNAVCPGGVATRFLDPIVGAEMKEKVLASGGPVHPLGRNATAAEIAGAIAYLASDDAGFVTGEAHVVDGGMSAGRIMDVL